MTLKLPAACIFVSAVLALSACTPPRVPPLPQTVRRIAVLPPYRPGWTDADSVASSALAGLPSRTIGDLLADKARIRLTEKGFEVISSSTIKLAAKNRVPTSPELAAQILTEANLDAAALYIEVRRWEPTPDSRGMKADGVIVALDATIIDPKTGAVLWQVHRPSRPVPVYGVVLTGQANVIVAETVMREIFP
jgi:hypothetical protein